MLGLTTLKCQIFRVRSILWAFVIPELILLFTTQGWSPQQYSIYFASNRVNAKKSAGLCKKHYSWITFFLVEKRDTEQSFRGAWEDQPRQRLSLEEMDPRNLFKSRNIFMQPEKRSQKNISWEIFFFEKTTDIHLFKGFDQENLAMAHSLAKAMRRFVSGSLKNLT